jgi:ABC-2 type transport system permease protein
MYWIQQLLIWTTLTNGLVVLFLGLPAGLIPEALSLYVFSLAIFFDMLVLLLTIFIPVLLQGIIIDERLSGTAAWILSKPVSKKAYLLSKLAASILAIVVVSVVINGVVGYGIFRVSGYTPDLLGFLMNLGLTGIVVAYLVCLTVMLGTITTSRGKVLAAAIGLTLGAQIVARYFPLILFLIPYSLPLAGLGLVTGDPIFGLEWMLLSASVQIVLFSLIALYVFDRTEL